MKKKIFSVLLAFALCLTPLLMCVPSFAAAEPEDNYAPPVEEEVVAAPLFQSAYDLFQRYIYGADTQLTEHMDLTLTILATVAALFVVLLPFVLVLGVIKIVTGR